MGRLLLRDGAGERLASAPWVHARANQRIVLPGATVAYLLQRSRRRSIGFSVDDQGLAVRAPRRLPLAEIEDALRRKSGWIRTKLAAAELRRDQTLRDRIRWRDGARLPYLGGDLLLRIEPCAENGRTRAHAVGSDTLVLRVPDGADDALLAALAQRWMQAQARALYAARLDHFAPQLGVRWQRLRLSSARTRWGSASTRGTISLHWRLVQMAPAIVDYVVVHELAHLLEMNHSARFWAHVARILPDCAERRRALKSTVLPPWA